VIAGALSCRPYLTLDYFLALSRDLSEEFKKMNINVVMRRVRPMLYTLEA